MPTPFYQREQGELAARLRSLRMEAGLSGDRLARELGWVQSKVSKIETLRQLPSEDDVTGWASRTGAGDDTTAGLLGMLRRARAEYADLKYAFSRNSAAGVQADILAFEAQSGRIAEFQPSMIPGLLQTAGYAREFLHLASGPGAFGADEADIEQMIAMRMRRQQVLYEHGKRVHIIVLEGALRCRVVSAPTLAGQLDRLIAIAGLSSLDLGVIPFERQVPVFPLSGFRLYDGVVVVESIAGEQQLSEPADVARYETFLALLRDEARYGKDAIAVIQRSLASLTGTENPD